MTFDVYPIYTMADPGEIDNSDDNSDDHVRHDSDVIEKQDEEPKEPEMWDVVLHNDDYTTKAFVVEVLRKVFRKSAVEATQLMMRVHKHGRGVIGTYTWDIAQSKVAKVHDMAKKRDFPLQCSVEKSS